MTIEETKLIYDFSRFGSSKGEFVNEAQKFFFNLACQKDLN